MAEARRRMRWKRRGKKGGDDHEKNVKGMRIKGKDDGEMVRSGRNRGWSGETMKSEGEEWKETEGSEKGRQRNLHGCGQSTCTPSQADQWRVAVMSASTQERGVM